MIPLPPSPLARAPRADACHSVLYAAPAAVQGAIAAIIIRDTHAAALSSAQRLSHFPASPLFSLNWFHGAPGGLIDPDGTWSPLPTVCLSGSQSRPIVSWAPGPIRAVTLCFTPDIARHLLGVEISALQDRALDATLALPAGLHPMLAALQTAPDDAAVLAALAQHLGPSWQRLSPGIPVVTPLQRIGRHWVETVALRAKQWRGDSGQRQVERRIRAYSGRSLRDWQALVRTEAAFHTARNQDQTGHRLDLAALAAETGFADQAHFSRETKRITGFPPGEFARRFREDESFWLYRLWG